MYILILILPLLSSLSLLSFGRNLGKTGAAFISLTCSFTLAVISFITSYEILFLKTKCLLDFHPWLSVGTFTLDWAFLFDTVTAPMLVVITSISFLVHLYSLSYMSKDPHLIRFLAYLSIFTFFMLLLVTAENFALLFFGWEGVGIASYLLINFWYTRIQANKAALKAIVLNRFGDIGLSLAIFGTFYLFKSLSFPTIFATVHLFQDAVFTVGTYEFSALTFISSCLFIGTIGKSAQLGLHTWLPDAMEGPTPVSALIHAATMVTAGVFLLIRCAPLLEYSSHILFYITVVGAVTAFFAGTVGMFQNDLKRVIAYSTCSQLGYMVFACGLSQYSLSLFHLMNHAFFKALLFLSAGVIIHALFDEQDMRRMGGLLRIMPVTYVVVLIGSLALMGFPFLTGFYSKDIILEIASSTFIIEGKFASNFGLLAALCTAFYSIRLIFLVFFLEPRFPKSFLSSLHDVSAILGAPLLILGFASIFVGFVFQEAFIGFGTDLWNGAFLFPNDSLERNQRLDAEFLPVWIKLCPLVVSLIGTFLASIVYTTFFSKVQTILLGHPISLDWYRFFSFKWYVDVIYNYFIASFTLWLGYEITFKRLDKGLIELFGPTSIVRSVRSVSAMLQRYQIGFVHSYLIFFAGHLCLLYVLSELNTQALQAIVLSGIFFLAYTKPIEA